MKLPIEDIIKSVKKEERTRGHVNLYLDKKVLARFKAFCAKHGVSHGRVLEELMQSFYSTKK